MSALERVKHTLRQWFGPYSPQDPALAALFGGKPVSSGVAVSEDTALTYTAVWACVQLIAGTLGSLPLLPYRRLKDGGKERMTDARLYRVLHDSPNDEMTSATFRETLQAHVLLWGNGFAEITRDGAGKVAALYPIEPWRVSVIREGPQQQLRYRIANPTKGSESVLRPEQILHIQGLSGDGVWGYSVIRKAREAVGLGLATEKFGAAFFGQGASFGGILTHPARLSDPARENLRKSINDRHQGVERAHNFIILEEGLKYDRLGIPPEDAQFLETRKFQLAEVARMFGCPPHMIGDVDRSTSWGTGIEQQGIGFVTYTMRRWFVRWEQELTRKLISPLEWQQQSVGFVVDGLLRGDTATRYEAYTKGRNGGWFSADDIRELEDMNPLPDGQGKVYLVPANMLPADQVANPPEPAPAPAPAPAAAVEAAAQAARALEALGALEGNVRALLAREPVVMPDFAPILERFDAAEAARAAPVEPPPPPPDLTPVLERLDAAEAARVAAEADRRDLRERIAALMPSVLAVVEEAAHDLVRREADRARRAATSPEKLAAWMADFYPRQGDYAVKVLGHRMQLHTALVGRPADTEREIRALIARYVTESTGALTALMAAPPADLKGTVATLTSQWETERPAALATALLQEALSDAAV